MKKLLLATVAAIPLIVNLPAWAWQNIPGNALWTLTDDFRSYPPFQPGTTKIMCQIPGGDFGWWHLVDDGSLGADKNCVHIGIVPAPNLTMNPQSGNSALVLSNATEGGGTGNYPSGNFDFKVRWKTTDTAAMVWKFSNSSAGNTFYSFLPTSTGWTLGKTVNGVSGVLASGSTPKFVSGVQHDIYVTQKIGGTISVFVGGFGTTGKAKVVVMNDPNPLTEGRFGFNTKSLLNVFYVTADRF